MIQCNSNLMPFIEPWILAGLFTLYFYLPSFHPEIRVDSSLMVKSKGEQEAYSAGTQKSGMYKLSGDVKVGKEKSRFLRRFSAENATKFIYSQSLLFLFESEKFRLEGHLS